MTAKITLKSKIFPDFRSIIFFILKSAIICALLLLGWLATQGALFELFVPRLQQSLTSNNVFGTPQSSGEQGSSFISKLIPSVNQLDFDALKSTFEKFAHGDPREISQSLSGEQTRQLSEMGMDITDQSDDESSRQAEYLLPLTTPENNLSKMQTIFLKIHNMISTAKDFLSNYEPTVFWGSLYFVVIWLVISCVLFFTRWKRAAKLLTGIMFSITAIFIKLSSMLYVIIFYNLAANPWQYALGALFWLPASLFIACAVFTTFLEHKIPKSKTLYLPLAYPILSGTIIYLKHFLPF